MNTPVTDELLSKYPIILNTVHAHQLKFILGALEYTLVNDIEGDVVELGCHYGTTSMFIQRMLNYFGSKKKLYVYDSFEGLPDISEHDVNNVERKFGKGSCKTELEKFYKNFDDAQLNYPIIVQGWFGEIPDDKYPEKISFAFLDGDFYNSIIDSFNKIYNKLSRDARVCVHDYGWEVLPGVKKACHDFLSDKNEHFIPREDIACGQLVKL